MDDKNLKLQEKRLSYSIAPDVTGFKILFVNVYMIGVPGEGNSWSLVDAGLPGSAKRIIKEAEQLFGKNNPPQVILLTHGHFDHVGALADLLKEWPGVKVYAHPYEIPYLTGQVSYPYPDPLAGDGAMSLTSWLFPVKPIDLDDNVYPITEDFAVPQLPEWTMLYTPGHTPGHISLFREKDRALIAGDAFITTDQNSLFSVVTQKRELHAPPSYFTINWQDAKNSVQKLANFKPEATGTGHGLPMFGNELKEGLLKMLLNFDKGEMPNKGYYVKHPVYYQDGRLAYAEPPAAYTAMMTIAKVTALALAGMGMYWLIGKIRKV
jgi:glyoxylase-like metal-dependent hydrolase (beta-lactamase superfamily II)